LAEEFQEGTFEILATMPLDDGEIVLGKFLAFAALAAGAIAGFLFFAAAAAGLAQPPGGLDWGETLGTLASLVLLAWLLGAAGVFASSWSKSQVIGYAGAFLIGFTLFLLGKVTPFLPDAAAALAGFLGFDAHMRALAKGVVDTRDLVYFASLIFLFLFLAAERLRRRRL
jgi:ABC-2 type transport system permease protein